MWLQLAMAALGAIKNGQKQTEANAREKENAVTNRLSPWTKRTTSSLPDGDVLGGALQGYSVGSAIDDNMKKNDADNALTDAETDRLKKGGSTWGTGKNPELADTGYLGGDYKFKGIDGGGINSKMSAPTDTAKAEAPAAPVAAEEKPTSYYSASGADPNEYGGYDGKQGEQDKWLNDYLSKNPWSAVNPRLNYFKKGI